MVEPNPQTRKSLPSILLMEGLAGVVVVPVHPSRPITWGSSAEDQREGLVAGGVCLSILAARGSASRK